MHLDLYKDGDAILGGPHYVTLVSGWLYGSMDLVEDLDRT